jgi:hypothetical protein
VSVLPEIAAKGLQTVRANALNDGDNTLIVAPGERKRIVVVGYQLRFVGAGAFQVKSGAGGTVHLDEVGVAAPGTRLTYSGTHDGPAIVCDENAALVVNNVATGDTFGHLTFFIRNR